MLTPYLQQRCTSVPAAMPVPRPRSAGIIKSVHMSKAVRTLRPQSRLHATPPDSQLPESQPAAGQSLPAKPAAWKWEDSDDALWAYGAFFTLLATGSIPGIQTDKFADLPYFIGLAALTIYIGAHRSLTTKQRQQLSLKQGALAPVFASFALFGVYLLIKFFPGFNIQVFLDCYFWLIGSIAITGATQPILRRVTGSFGTDEISVNIPDGLLLDDEGEPVTKATFTKSDVVAAVGAVALVSAELASHHTNFTLNNLVACLIATDILQLVGLRSFRTAGAMLLGLLAYDVFWVFGSPYVLGDNVMLKVATSDIFVGPTRLLFPRIAGGTGEAASFPFSLLGLGDIAVPGILACLALRYDASRSVDMRGRAVASMEAISAALGQIAPGSTRAQYGATAVKAAEDAYDTFADREVSQRDASVAASGTDSTGGGDSLLPAPRVPVTDAVLQHRPYFLPVIGAYVAGLVIAFAANYVTNLGQPALLYIVPSTLGIVVLTALQRQEVQRVWSFNDVESFGTLEAVRVKAAAEDNVKKP